MFRTLFGMLAAAAAFACAQPYSGTIFNFPDSFRDSDPSALAGVTYVGRQQKSVYDRRSGNVSINAYVYKAAFNDGNPDWSLWVNPEFSQENAATLAAKYARNIGQMPICIRSSISGAVIHDGDNPWGGGNPLTIHHIQGLSYERSGIVTETMIHESTHAAFDPKYYIATWSAAAAADAQFISTYARDNPLREDHAETFLCWLVARFKKDRIPAADLAKITSTIPNRLKWYDSMGFNLDPVGISTRLANRAATVPTVFGSANVDANGRRLTGMTSLPNLRNPKR